jgi:ABC-type transporter Mla MlaB component
MRSDWLTINEGSEDAVVVIAAGGIAADRALDLWATVEEALERAVGRLVAVDLHHVTSFDAASVDTLIRLARSAHRQRVSVCALLLPDSALYRYVERRRSVHALSIYPTLADALDDVEGHTARRVR